MRRTLAAFLFGVVVGSTGVGAIAVVAGDPYDYSVLRPYACERVKRDPSLLWSGEVVPDQDNPCFVRYPQYPAWLMLHR